MKLPNVIVLFFFFFFCKITLADESITNYSSGLSQECFKLKKSMGYQNQKADRMINKGKRVDNVLKRYDYYLEKYKKEGCDSPEQYREEIIRLSYLAKERNCEVNKQSLTEFEQHIEVNIAQGKGDIIQGIVRKYAKNLDYLKAQQCLADYSTYDEKVQRWHAISDPNTYFFVAMKNNDIAGVRMAIAHGLEIKTATRPLKLAIKRNKPDVVKLLVEKGANVNLKENGTHPLNYYMNSSDKKTRIDMIKLLVSLGADVSLSRSDTVIKLAAQMGDITFIKQLESVPLTANDYAVCFWSTKEDNTALKTMCAEKIRANTLDRRWADITEGMTDNGLSEDILYTVNKSVKKRNNLSSEIKKVKVISDNWKLQRSKQGFIKYREATALGYAKNQYGVCYAQKIRVRQEFDGLTYGKSKTLTSNVVTLDCDE